MNFSCFAAGVKDYWNSPLVSGKPMASTESLSSCQLVLSFFNFLLSCKCLALMVFEQLYKICLLLIVLCNYTGSLYFSPHLVVCCFFVVVYFFVWLGFLRVCGWSKGDSTTICSILWESIR